MKVSGDSLESPDQLAYFVSCNAYAGTGKAIGKNNVQMLFQQINELPKRRDDSSETK
ncbi:hypothetical protein [Candidatus Electrothrix sp.]|uniref:hypothetical protein n=1 Tax=Candidatus Electrothrix sp. TaxID=2170559 RepID=UPI0040560C91